MSAGTVRIDLAGTKGGTGTSTYAAAVAILAAKHGRRTLAVDVTGTGDLAALMGLGSRPEAGAVCEVAPNLYVLELEAGAGGADAPGFDLTVWDHGTHRVDGAYLVTDPSYLALRRLMSGPVHAPGIILQDEPGRALGRQDVASVTQLPVVACVPRRSNIARASDAGVLPTRLPEPLELAAAVLLRGIVGSPVVAS